MKSELQMEEPQIELEMEEPQIKEELEVDVKKPKTSGKTIK